MIKLIASDIDGTLLTNHGQIVPERTADLIRRLIDKGIYFTAASGRQYSNLRRMFDPISENICYAAENGCLCAHKNEIISKMYLPQDICMDIIDAIHDFPDCYGMVSGVNTSYIDTDNPEIYDLIKNTNKYNVTKVKDLKTDVPEPILKIAVCAPKHGTTRIGPHFGKLFHGEVHAVTAGLIWVDFVGDNANKGLGLKAILDYLHIDPSECIAFGDQLNDIEMLKVAGTSYAMSTGMPEVRALANHITDCVDDVLEEILRTL